MQAYFYGAFSISSEVPSGREDLDSDNKQFGGKIRSGKENIKTGEGKEGIAL